MKRGASRGVALATLVVLAACAAGCSEGSEPVECEGVDLSSDPRNCGGCGVLCTSGAQCVAGECGCPAGTLQCGACVPADDPANCGACGNVCPAGSSCVSGACECAAGTELCGDRCVALDADPAHCGACGNACGPGQVCDGGACACPDAGQTACSDGCHDLDTEAAHCGACFQSCDAPRVCALGSCECPAGATFCSGRCVTLSSDVDHCGACGVRCEGGAACRDGVCSPRYAWHAVRPSGGFMTLDVEWDGRVAMSDDGSVYLAYSTPGDSVQLVRFTPDGVESWTQTFYTSAERVGGIAATADGGVVLTATFRSSWSSPGLPARYSAGSTDVAVVALDSAGAVRWQYFVRSTGRDLAGSVAVAPSRVVVAGSVGGSFDYGGGTLYADPFRDAFVVVLDDAGAYVGARVYGDGGTEQPVYVALAPDGDIVVAGESGAGVDFGGGRTSSTTGGFVARLGPDFTHRWSRSLPVAHVDGVVAGAEDVYVSGSVERTTDFGGGVTLTVPRFDQAAFLVALTGTSGTARWVAGHVGTYVEQACAPVIEAGGDVWSGASAPAGLGGYDAVLSAWNRTSGAESFTTILGGSSEDLVSGLAIGSGRLAIAGRFEGTAYFGGRAESASDRDVFVVVFEL